MRKLVYVEIGGYEAIAMQPVSVLIYVWAVLNSMLKVLSRGGIEWRGTFYSLKELRKHTL